MPNISVSSVQGYDPAVAAGIANLYPELDPNFSSEPLSEEWLNYVGQSPDYAQLYAVDEDTESGLVVGAATLSIVRGGGFNKRGQLEDFIVHPDYQGHGVALMMHNSMMAWGAANNLPRIAWESETYRTAAQRFYRKVGATPLLDAVHFEIEVK